MAKATWRFSDDQLDQEFVKYTAEEMRTIRREEAIPANPPAWIKHDKQCLRFFCYTQESVRSIFDGELVSSGCDFFCQDVGTGRVRSTPVKNTSPYRARQRTRLGTSVLPIIDLEFYPRSSPESRRANTSQVSESSTENSRVRFCTIFYYLEDGTMQLTEHKTENSGLPQGALVCRHCIHRADGNGHIGLDDLHLGTNIEIYKRFYRIVGCDAFTRSEDINLKQNDRLGNRNCN